jgi:16S rRNA (guanine(966)-N(2))-methyltransferase RsmD
MRVISGSARGLKLKAPEGLGTRPTTDRIKESLFNIIAQDIYGCCFLDLFSGSGAMAVEALSRGAERAVLIDKDSQSIRSIRANVEAARVSDRAEIMSCDVMTGIAALGKRGERFDIIFMDPPYNKGLVQESLAQIVKAGILAEDGFIIAEQSQDDPQPEIDGLNVYRVKDYKITKMTFLSAE